MPSRLSRTLLVLAALSTVGVLAPGRASAEPTHEQRMQWMREIKLAIARRIASEGLQKAREREFENALERGSAEALRQQRRRDAEAGVSPPATGAVPEPPTDGLRLEAPAWFSRATGAVATWAAPTADPETARSIGARQIRVPPGPDREGGPAPPGGAARAGGRLRTDAAQGFATNVRVSDPNLDDPDRGDTQSETTIAAYQSNVVVAWNEGRATGHSPIGYAYSTNGGETFTAGGYPSEGNNDVFWTSDPVLTVNEKTGEFYLCALADPVNDLGFPTNGVAVVRGTFSGTTFSWGTPRFVNTNPEPSFIDKPWAVVDSLSGNLYVSYTRYAYPAGFGAVDSIWVQRSTNQGLTWSAPFALSRAPGQLVQGSRVAVGPAGEVYAMWKEIVLTSPNGEDSFRLRKSTDFGVSWGASEITVTDLFDNFGTGAPGFNRDLGISFPSLVVDRTTGPRRGRVYVTWNETVAFWGSFPDTMLQRVNETEANDTTFTANPFTPGQTLLGAYNDDQDWDYWRFNATAGTTFIFFSTSSNLYTMRVFCTDQVTRLAFSGDRDGNELEPAPGVIVWTAPATATYYLRIAVIEGAFGRYTIGTAVDVPNPGLERSRDTRDIFVRSSPDGVDWSAPAARVNADPVGFDNWLPEIAVAGGRLYTAWYDFSGAAPTACGGESHVTLALSDDGGSTWGDLGPVTDVTTNWSYVNSNIIPNQGDYIALFANTAVIYPSWADGRCAGAGCLSTPDVMAAPFVVNGLQITVTNVVVDTGHVAITWQVSGPTVTSANLYRRVGVGAYAFVTALVPDGAGRVFYDDQTVETSTQYSYRLGVDVNGTEVFLAERTVQVPGPPPPALAFAGVQPNPTPGPLRVSFTLPTTETAWLTLFDAGGRRLREWDVSSLGAGSHSGFDFGAGLDLDPGIYFIRLRQAGRETTKRVAVIP